jgi:hypothetical protein
VNKPAFEGKDVVKISVIVGASICVGATCLGATSRAQASPGNQGIDCVARVLHSEELPYAPIGDWRAHVTLEVTPSNGSPFIKTWHDNVTWQRSAPRRGETFRVRCDPANQVLY